MFTPCSVDIFDVDSYAAADTASPLERAVVALVWLVADPHERVWAHEESQMTLYICRTSRTGGRW